MAKPAGTEVEHEEGVVEYENQVGSGYVFQVSLTDTEILADVEHTIDTKLSILRNHMVKFSAKRRKVL